jgi:hypothetical protein
MKKNLLTLPFRLEGLVRTARIPAYATHAISTTPGERALMSDMPHGAAVRIDSLGPRRSKP